MNGQRGTAMAMGILGRRRALLALAALAVAGGLVMAACSSSAAPAGTSGSEAKRQAAGATAAPALPAPAADSKTGAGASNENGGAAVSDLYATLQASLIVRTGSLSIEVADLDKATSQAQAKIVGMGGYVAQSSRTGAKESATASVTYRVPVARWDDAVGALRGLATSVLDERTDSSDVTGQVVDIQARLDNFQATEKALQAIMARAVAIPDVLAVQQQLTTVQGEIEQLTAQRDHLKDQAAMSTLAVSYQLPGTPVVAQAASGWDAGGVLAEAVAALVHVGQGLATVAIWIIVVGLPIGIALLVMAVLARMLLRWTGRGRRTTVEPS